MTEIIDQASALETMMREQAIQAHRINRDTVSATHSIPVPKRAAEGCQTYADYK